MMNNRNYNLKNFLSLFMLISLLLVGCGDNYGFNRLKNEAEKALQNKEYEKAKKIYSRIYQKEKESSDEFSQTAWAYYRLGVIHELTGKVKLAKGYYWGDQIEDGYYARDPRVEWLARNGWQWLDQNNPPRSLKKILELELRLKPPEKQKIRTKKEIKVKKKAEPDFKPVSFPDNQPTRIFNRSLTPPPPGTPEPFRVLY
ncbi:MAG: hypothetical protein ACQETH_01990 [Candidatus Rifleibacteriota bacterium]